MERSSLINVDDNQAGRLVKKLIELTQNKSISWGMVYDAQDNPSFAMYVAHIEYVIMAPVFITRLEGGYVYLIRIADRKELKPSKHPGEMGSGYPRLYSPYEFKNDSISCFYAICVQTSDESPVYRITGAHIDEFQSDIISLYTIAQTRESNVQLFIERINNL